MEPPGGWWICWWGRICVLCEWLPHPVPHPQIVVLEERMLGWSCQVGILTRRADEMDAEMAVLQDQPGLAGPDFRVSPPGGAGGGVKEAAVCLEGPAARHGPAACLEGPAARYPNPSCVAG